jgi:hypothetical protein
MRKAIGIFFLLIVTLSYTELHQLLKLPVAIEHFREHRRTDPGISFSSFLLLHYFNGDKQDADYKRDMQLPFKSSADCSQLILLSLIIPSHSGITIQPPVIDERNNFPVLQEGVYSCHLTDIWQPPRKA